MSTHQSPTKRTTLAIAGVIFFTSLFSTITQAETKDPTWIVRGKECMVASDHHLASMAGLRILKRGGNAVDAACAVSFALAVSRPQSTGLGGGGFMMVRMANSGETTVIDSRETAPAASSSNMYDLAVAADPTMAPPSRYAHLAVAVPGLLAGNTQALQQFGTMKLDELLAPAIEISTNGFEVDDHYVKACHDVLSAYEAHPTLRQSCSYVYEVHLRKGKLPRIGDRLRQPALAKLLQAIADQGPNVFYHGPVAAAIEQEMKRHHGIMTQADMANYRVSLRAPLVSSYREFQIITVPPPSSGGTCIIESLNILENVDLAAVDKSNAPLARHYMIETMKHAFADRARWMADPAFADIPTKLITSKPYAKRLASLINHHAVSKAAYGTTQLPEDKGTSHFSIVDRWGNCVVSTETINTEFGSLSAVGEWGLILNNEMDDFAAEHGRPNAFGLTQSDRNAPEPGKRPLSSMSPTIVLKEQKPVLLLGASGGPRIITAVLNVMINVLDFNLPLAKAIENTRVHHQWMPNEVAFDQKPDESIATALRSLGHTLAKKQKKAMVQAIQIHDGALIGASDPRKGGRPAGY